MSVGLPKVTREFVALGLEKEPPQLPSVLARLARCFSAGSARSCTTRLRTAASSYAAASGAVGGRHGRQAAEVVRAGSDAGGGTPTRRFIRSIA